MDQPPDETARLLTQAKMELDDRATVWLVSTFKNILFNHEQSPLRSKPSRKGAQGLSAAIKPFEKLIARRTYEDVERLGLYRHCVVHGQRWEKPAHADPGLSFSKTGSRLVITHQFTQHRYSMRCVASAAAHSDSRLVSD